MHLGTDPRRLSRGLSTQYFHPSAVFTSPSPNTPANGLAEPESHSPVQFREARSLRREHISTVGIPRTLRKSSQAHETFFVPGRLPSVTVTYLVSAGVEVSTNIQPCSDDKNCCFQDCIMRYDTCAHGSLPIFGRV